MKILQEEKRIYIEVRGSKIEIIDGTGEIILKNLKRVLKEHHNENISKDKIDIDDSVHKDYREGLKDLVYQLFKKAQDKKLFESE